MEGEIKKNSGAGRPETEQEKLARLNALLSLKRKIVCENNFSEFCKSYLGSLMPQNSPSFHQEMKLLIERAVLPLNDKNRVERLLFIAPRGFAKSTVCSVMLPLWLASFNKRKDIFLVSATISLAKELLRKVRYELETNPKILTDFGEQKSDKWTEETLILNNGTVIRAKGRGFQIRGFRPDFIVCDDLEDEEVIYSKEQRDKLEQWFLRTLLPALKPDQELLYVGTKIHQFSLINKLQAKDEFVSRFYQALTNGQSIWEDLWPTERLKKLRTEMGTYAFEAEYQNNPISQTEQPIKPHMLEGVRIEGADEVTCLAIDPAISEKTSADYRAFVIMGRNESGFREIYSERGKWGIEEQIERIVDLYDKYRPTKVVIEEIAFQRVYRPLLLKEARTKGLFIPIQAAQLKGAVQGGHTLSSQRPRDKFTRLISVAHLFEQKLVQIDNQDLREELLTFPHGEHDDLVDACVYALTWLVSFRPSGVAKKQETKKIVAGTKDSFFIREVRPGVFISEKGSPNITPQLLLDRSSNQLGTRRIIRLFNTKPPKPRDPA